MTFNTGKRKADLIRRINDQRERLQRMNERDQRDQADKKAAQVYKEKKDEAGSM